MSYHSEEIYQLNQGYPWNKSINCELVQNNKKTDSEKKYKLYATGDADLNGRKYIALPENHKLNETDKIKYNIL